MKTRIVLGILLTLALTIPSFAQGKVVLTLQGAIQRALEQNLDVQISGAEAEKAKLEVNKKEAIFKPQVSMSASPLTWEGDYDLLEYSPSTGLDASLHTQGGGEISLNVTEEMQEEGRMQTSLTLGLTQQIIPSPQYDPSLLSLEKSYLGLEQQTFTSEQELEDVKLEVMSTFYQALKQEKKQELAELSLQQAEENLKIIEDKKEEGMANQLDVLDAQMQHIQAEEALSEAKSSLSESMIDLKELVGISPEKEIVLEDESSIEYRPLNIQMEDAVGKALENNLQIKKQELAVKMQELDLTVSEADLLPSVNLLANYEYNKTGLEEENYKVGLVAEVPVLDGGEGKTGVQIAKQKIRKAELSLQKLKQNISQTVREYFYELERMERKLVSLKLSREKQKQALGISEKMLSEGATTTQQVRERKISLKQTQIDYLQALVDYKLLKARFLKTIGKGI